MTSSVKVSMPQSVWWIDEPLARAEQLVGDDQRADRVVAGAAAGVADDVGVALASPANLAGSSRASMQVRIAKRRAGGMASSALSPKDCGVGGIRLQHLVPDRAHAPAPPKSRGVVPW